MSSLSVSLHLYRLSNDGTTNFSPYGVNRVVGVFPEDVEIRMIKRITPVNALLAPSLYGLPWLYSKLTFQDPAILQEVYVMQSLAQMHVLINA